MRFCDTCVALVKILSGTFSAFTASIILLVMFDALLLTDRQVTTRLEAPRQIWTYKKDFLAQLEHKGMRD